MSLSMGTEMKTFISRELFTVSSSHAKCSSLEPDFQIQFGQMIMIIQGKIPSRIRVKDSQDRKKKVRLNSLPRVHSPL